MAIQKLDSMPVIRELKDFDARSGSLLERLIFNHRRLVIFACLLVTLVLSYFAATRLELNASFEKMIPHNQPFIKTTWRTATRCVAWAVRYGWWWKISRATSSTLTIWKC